MKTIGLIGAGHIGSQLARLAVKHGYDVVLSNSRGPETLSELVAELGPHARAATATDAAKAGDIILLPRNDVHLLYSRPGLQPVDSQWTRVT